jgi:hypothetical protein
MLKGQACAFTKFAVSFFDWILLFDRNMWRKGTLIDSPPFSADHQPAFVAVGWYPQPNRSRYRNELRFFRQGICLEPLHLVDVSNQIHRKGKISIAYKLKKESTYVMLHHNKWGVPESLQ